MAKSASEQHALEQQRAAEQRRVIRAPDGKVDWSGEARTRGADVTTIIIGDDPHAQQNGAAIDGSAIPLDLATLFPQLTHLYVWGVAKLSAIPALPMGLISLDVRACPDLTSLCRSRQDAPSTLETLVVQRCDALQRLADHLPRLTQLRELCLRDLPVTNEEIGALLGSATALRLLEIANCPGLTTVQKWPTPLVEIRLNGCEALATLPGKWPGHLRRLDLNGVTSIQSLPDDEPTSLDYVGLRFTRSLKRLPARPHRGRTLFLFGSGVLTPPASEHGREENENVAQRTEDFFRDVALVGQGQVRRCKLLLLGNGGAGKTTLALALDPERDPTTANALGSTHAVQFWEQQVSGVLEGRSEQINLHVWDFGGQEIYHNTHAIFIRTGAVFVVVWKPEQEDRKAPRVQKSYQDVWRPLGYWLDLIHLLCLHAPRIAVVCSHADTLTYEPQQRYRECAELFAERHPLFVLDSLRRAPQVELDCLKQWIDQQVVEVVATQGTAVPTYWEVAQCMVEGWVKRLRDDRGFAADHNQLTSARFGELLWEAIGHAITNDPDGSCVKLKQAVEATTFKLTDDRIRRTLEFLTNSGWLFWRAELFQGRVIVGQQWALDAIYAVLERKDSAVYEELLAKHGRFTCSDLHRLCWKKAGFDQDEEELLISYMVDCRVAFKLRRKEDSWLEEDLFVSVEHLPSADEMHLARIFERLTEGQDVQVTIEEPRLHRLHWHKFLADVAAEYGAAAEYARDGFHFRSVEGNEVFHRCLIHSRGMGGTIEVRAAGTNRDTLLETAVARIRKHLPDAGAEATDQNRTSMGQAKLLKVFLSYAWDDDREKRPSESAYEAPIDEIERMLNGMKFVDVVRDKTTMRYGDDLTRFMQDGAQSDLVVVVHSDLYFRSINCVYGELAELLKGLVDRQNSFAQVVIPVELSTSRIREDDALQTYIKYWTEYTGKVPTRFEHRRSEIRDVAKHMVQEFSVRVSRLGSVNEVWAGKGDEVLAAIKKKVEGRLAEVRRDEHNRRGHARG